MIQVPFENFLSPFPILFPVDPLIKPESDNGSRCVCRRIFIIQLILFPGHASAAAVIPCRFDIIPYIHGLLYVPFFSGNIKSADEGKRHPLHIIIPVMQERSSIFPESSFIFRLKTFQIISFLCSDKPVQQRIQCMGMPPVNPRFLFLYRIMIDKYFFLIIQNLFQSAYCALSHTSSIFFIVASLSFRLNPVPFKTGPATASGRPCTQILSPQPRQKITAVPLPQGYHFPVSPHYSELPLL